MSEDNVKKLLRRIYKDPESTQRWLASPLEKSKEWDCQLDAETISTVRSTVHFVDRELEQDKSVNERMIKKINEASRHGIFSFYVTLGVNISSFIIGIVIFSMGTYAFFVDRGVLGFFFCVIGIAQIAYFLVVKPLQKMNENIGDLVQMEVAIGSWLNEMSYWQSFVRNSSLEERQIIAQTMRDAAKWAIMLIEDYSHSNRQKAADSNQYSDLMSKANSMLNKMRQRPSEEKNEKLLSVEKKEAPSQEKANEPVDSQEKKAEESADKTNS